MSTPRATKTDRRPTSRKVAGHTLAAAGPGCWLLGDFMVTNYDHDGPRWSVERPYGGVVANDQTVLLFGSLAKAVRWIAAQEVAA